MAAARENINIPLVVTISAVFAILVLVLVLLLEAWFFSLARGELTRKIAAVEESALVVEQDNSRAEMNSYAWVDQEKGVVQIPIDRAMELVAQEGLGPQVATE